MLGVGLVERIDFFLKDIKKTYPLTKDDKKEMKHILSMLKELLKPNRCDGCAWVEDKIEPQSHIAYQICTHPEICARYLCVDRYCEKKCDGIKLNELIALHDTIELNEDEIQL